MKNKIKNVTVLNALTSLGLQIVTIFSGFIIPRLILQTFGSEVNGLVSSLNQFLNYISLLEGGVSSVIMANLYKPLITNDTEKLSSVIHTTQRFFRRVALVFLVYSLILAIVYPIIFKQSFSYEYVSTLTIILAINLFVQYNFSLTWKQLLNADKKVYIVSIIQILLILVNTILFAIIIKIYPDIHVLKFITAILYIIQPIVYKIIIKKYYKLDKKAPYDNELLKDRWAGFGINIAYFLHFNTDVTILTIFSDLKVVSIYGVYSLVTSGLRALVSSISSGIAPSVGHAYASGDKEKLNELFDRYEYVTMLTTFLFFAVGGLLITPFVMMYTNGVNDINYYQPVFGVILILAEAIYCLRNPYMSLAYSANKFKDISKHAYIEAGLNILFSIILVVKFNLIGIAIGTLIAMTYRTIYHIVYLRKNILNRPVKIFLKNFSIFTVFSFLGIIICLFYSPFIDNIIIEWVVRAIIYTTIFSLLYIIMTFIFFKEEFNYFSKILRKKNRTTKEE